MKTVLVLTLLMTVAVVSLTFAEETTLTVDVAKMIIPAVEHEGEIPLDEGGKPIYTELEWIELWVEGYLQKQELRFRKSDAGKAAKAAVVNDPSAISIKK